MQHAITHENAQVDAQTGPCRLCLQHEARRSTQPWNQPLFESPNFDVLPSLGALVEGWLLIIPRDHYLSSGAIPGSLTSELSQVKSIVAELVSSTFGPATVFEHGPSGSQHLTGCGIDHAHLHVVPLEFDLRIASEPLLPSGVSFKPGGVDACRAAVEAALDYLYLELPGRNGLIATSTDFGSQLFRHAIARQLGIADEYKWRDYPQMPKVARTIERLTSLSLPKTIAA